MGFQFAIKKSIGALTCKRRIYKKQNLKRLRRIDLYIAKMFQFLNKKYLSSIAEKTVDGRRCKHHV